MAKKPIKSPKKKAAKKSSSVKSDVSFADPLKLAAKASARKKLNKK
jgi:hypothetical protein